MPRRSAVSSTPSSGSRSSRLNSFSTAAKRRSPRSCAARSASSSCSDGEVGAGDLAHLALLHQPVHGLERVADGHRRIGLVVVVQVHVVGAQAAQAALERAWHGLVVRLARRLVAELGGDDRLVAPASERPADVLLRTSLAVGLGRVDQRDALVERGVHDLAGLRRVEPPAEVVGPESRDETSRTPILRCSMSLSPFGPPGSSPRGCAPRRPRSSPRTRR